MNFRDNDQIVDSAVKNHKYEVLLYASQRLQLNYKQCYIIAVRNTKDLRLPQEYNDDESLVRAFVMSDPCNYETASTRLQCTPSIAMLVVCLQPKRFRSLLHDMKTHKLVIHGMLHSNIQNLQFISNWVIEEYAELQNLQTLLKKNAPSQHQVHVLLSKFLT